MNVDCECGNNCYNVIVHYPEHDGATGWYEVSWQHDPADCPYGCEDCLEEGQTRKRIERMVME